MGFDKLIQSCVILAFIVAASGQLPRIITYVHRAQVQLIQDSKASKWPKVGKEA